MTDWYRIVEGQTTGPISDAEISRLVQTGQVGSHELLWRPGMQGWTAAGAIPALFTPPPVPALVASAVTSPREIPIAPPVIQPQGLPGPARGAAAQVAGSSLPTGWLQFWVWVRLPIGAGLLVLAAAFQAIEESLPGIAVLFAISLAIGLVVLAVGLHRRRLWAWRGIWYLLGIDWLLFALSPVSPPISMNPLDWWFLRFAGFGLAWVLPNFVYFKKRRALFC